MPLCRECPFRTRAVTLMATGARAVFSGHLFGRVATKGQSEPLLCAPRDAKT